MADIYPIYLYESLTTITELAEGTRLCFCPILNRMYIVKRMPLSSEKVMQRIKELHSKALVRIYAIIQIEGALDVVCDYVSGTPLSVLLQNGNTIDKADAVRYCTEICSGLTVLHKAGIVHRDINPNNIIISSCGHAVLIDYGIARNVEPEKSADTTILGTPGYAAPEQFGFTQSDERTDIYALGVLLNIMVTGKLPGEQRANGEIGSIVKKCTVINARGRYRSAKELMCVLKTKQYHLEEGLLDGVVKNIPGLRSQNHFIQILAVLGYVLWVLATCIAFDNARTDIDKCLNFCLVWFFMWVLPYILFYNAFGIWDRIPFSAGSSPRNQRIVYSVFGCMSIVLSVAIAGAS